MSALADWEHNRPELRFSEFKTPWCRVYVRELLSEPLSNGVFNDPKLVGSGYKLVNVKDMYGPEPIDTSTLSRVAIDKSEFIRNKVNYGDLFFTRSSLVKEGIAHSNVYLSEDEGVTFDGHLIRLRTRTDECDPMFLHMLLKTNFARRQLVARGKTGTMTTIGQSDIESVFLVLPSLPEQKKIADFLGAVNGKLAALREKEAALTRFKRGLMQALFSQTLRFTRDDGSSYPDWEEKCVGDLVLADSGYPVPGDEILETPTPTPLLRGVNITEGRIRHSAEMDRYFGGELRDLERYLLQAGDVVIGMDGSKVGKNVAIISDRDAGAFLIQRVARIQAAHENDLRYIYHHVTSNRFRQYVDRVNTSSGIPHISLKQIREFPIIRPHPDEQTKIADALSAMDSKIQAVGDQIAQLSAFKHGLLQQMFV
tara:strand:+ start:3134 stop:4408 length:1275 start_codon:yes stop_codon:yes gene_type:complete